MAGNESLEDWRIIKDEQLESAALSPKTMALRAQKSKSFRPMTAAEQPIITDQEWNELKDIWT